MKYALAFARPLDGSDKVLVVRKNRPDWQKNKINLCGGKIDGEEAPEQAAVRELKEESGIDATTIPKVMGIIYGSWGEVYCVKVGVFDCEIKQPPEETEPVSWVSWKDLKDDSDLMPNLKVIIPLMMAGVEGWVIEDERPDWSLPIHSIKVSVKI